jgi:hypothetical protein
LYAYIAANGATRCDVCATAPDTSIFNSICCVTGVPTAGTIAAQQKYAAYAMTTRALLTDTSLTYVTTSNADTLAAIHNTNAGFTYAAIPTTAATYCTSP